jgi:hypothetical protein
VKTKFGEGQLVLSLLKLVGDEKKKEAQVVGSNQMGKSESKFLIENYRPEKCSGP